MKILKPEIFQGSLQKKNYFEGWYFKHVTSDKNQVFAFIPGISLLENDRHAFIQVINGITQETHYITYPLNQFSWEKEKLMVKVGDSVFSEDYIDLNIQTPEINVAGKIFYRNRSRFPGTLIQPGIMGWYSWVPFMECYHGVVSANHWLQGILRINSAEINFDNGKGYIEKDWGSSFPECWIWLQSNSFENKNASVFFSVAKIPWLGKFFMGFISFLFLNGKFYLFATYNGSKLVKTEKRPSGLEIELENSRNRLKINVKTGKAGELIAPVKGQMTRRIKESIDSEVQVVLTDKNGNVLFSGQSGRAGLEVSEEIFGYL